MLLLLPIVIPIAAGLLLLLFKAENRPLFRNIWVFLSLAATLSLSVAAAFQPENTFTLFSITDKLVFALASDSFSKLFSLLSSSVWIVAGVFAFEYIKHENNKTRFFVFYLIVIGVLNALYFSANIITMYLFFELATLVSVPLVLHSMRKEAVAAAMKYLFYSIAGAFTALFGIFYIYDKYSPEAFVLGGSIDLSSVENGDTLLLVSVMLIIIGFGTKAGMYPMHSWLTAAHPEAPAPASAVLSAIIAKAGIFTVVRVVYYTVGVDFIRGTWVQYTWLVLALITVFMGSMMAYREKLLKKRLAYSSISQISYIMLGLAMMTDTSFTGALYHVIFHAVIKSGLFLVAGAFIYKTGNTDVDSLKGIGKKMPITLWCWTFLSLALIGIPPFCGFVSKWKLALGSLDSGISVFSWLSPVILLVSALLTAGYLLPVTINGFFPGKEFQPITKDKPEASPLMLIPLCVLAFACLAMGFVFPL